jgi:hypothetical protein
MIKIKGKNMQNSASRLLHYSGRLKSKRKQSGGEVVTTKGGGQLLYF